jgi:heterodisulfide reductase subunit C2
MCAEELDFVEKYDLLGCIQCGRCTGGCPVALRTDLRVRCFMNDTQSEERLEELSEKPEIWDCTTCYTCAARCPKGLEPMEVLIGLRSLQIEEGKVQPTVRDALESIFKDGNPWGSPRAKRLDWASDLEVEILEP